MSSPQFLEPLRLRTGLGALWPLVLALGDRTEPTFRRRYGSGDQLKDGASVRVDEEYLHPLVQHPRWRRVDEFSSLIPPYENLSDRQVSALVEIIKEQQ